MRKTKPKTPAPPTSPKNRGTYTFNNAGHLGRCMESTPPLGTAIETFYNARQGEAQMNANSNLYSPLVATKIN